MTAILKHPPHITKSAVISECGLYRYELRRTWDDSLPVLVFVLANPSDADASIDDPTVRKCIGFATRLGFGGILIVNLYAYRTPYTKALRLAAKAGVDVVGPDNWFHIERALQNAFNGGGAVCCAWGNASKLPRDSEFQINTLIWAALGASMKLRCLHKTKVGSPYHPCMLGYGFNLKNWP